MADVAERHVLSIPAGERESHRLAWCLSEGRSANSHLGTLHWSVHVHGEQTVDLEVSCELRPQKEGGEPTLVLLQEVTRDKKFLGSFEPAKDSRLVEARGGSTAVGEDADLCAEVEAIVFEFSAGFSWFNGKEIELILVRHRPPVQLRSEVLSLPALEPLPAPPRCSEAPSFEGGVGGPPPDLRKLPASASSLPDGAAGDMVRFARHLDALLEAWLEGVEAKCPRKDLATECGVGGAWLEELEDRVTELRGSLQRGPHPLHARAQANNGEASGEESSDLHVGAAVSPSEDKAVNVEEPHGLASPNDAAVRDAEDTKAEEQPQEAEAPAAPKAETSERVEADHEDAGAESKIEVETTAEADVEGESQLTVDTEAAAAEREPSTEVESALTVAETEGDFGRKFSTTATFDPGSGEEEPNNRLDEVSEGSEGESET